MPCCSSQHDRATKGPCGIEQGWPMQQQRQQHAPQHAQPSAPFQDYGSPAANEAVQQLQSLGATVHPPEAKDAMDWGVLAGEQ